MGFDVFISSSSDDKDYVNNLCSCLEKNSISCWVAVRDSLPGKNYGASIIEAINNCKLVILVFTKNSNKSEFVHREIERAASKKKCIILLKLEEVEVAEEMELYVSDFHWFNAVNLEFNKFINTLIDVIKKNLNIPLQNLQTNKKEEFTKDKKDSAFFNDNNTLQIKACSSCGFSKIPIEAAFCPKCGKKVQNNNNDKEDAKFHFNSGNAKYRNSDYQGSIKDYTIAIELDPNFAEAYYNRGISKKNLQDYKGAIDDNTNAIKLNLNNEAAYNNLGVAKYYLQDYQEAIKDYTKAIELNPNYADVYTNRGIVKNDLHDYEGAIKDYTKAIELKPNYAMAYCNRGISKKNLHDCEGAIIDYTKAIELDPNSTEAYSNRGVSKNNLQDYQGAIKDYTKAIELNSNYANFLLQSWRF